MTDTDPLVTTLVAIVVELAWRAEDFVDDDGGPQAVSKTLDWIAWGFDGLEPDQRARLAEVVAQLAAEAEPGERREFMESFAEDFGLLSDDE